MEAESRIERMERTGVITARQAEQLRASLGRAPRATGRRRAAGILWIAGIVAVFAIVAVMMLASPGSAPTIQDVSQTFNDPGAQGAMNRSILNLIAVVLLLLIPVTLLALVYNGLVNREEGVLKAWAQVESQLQRRADLVPSLVEVVSGYAQYERQTLEGVTAARGEALERTVTALTQGQESIAALLDDAELLDDQARMDELARLQQQAGTRMRSFLALAENYPQLRASDQFLELQAQLEGTENRINVARLQFNESVGAYNAAIRRLPGTLVAGLGGFQRKAYFQADGSAAQAPAIELD